MADNLKQYFTRNKKRQIYKWVHYFDVYDQFFKRYVGQPVTIVEFGVMHGGSLQMWKHYFGPHARVIGVDFNARCKEFEEKQIEIFIGDQEDRKFLRKLRKEIGPIDIVVDDGGHTMNQQKTTFEEMWPAIKDGGVYVVEDVHTSYWRLYNGGYKKQNTFVAFSKNLIDQINAWHARGADKKRLKIDKYTKSIKAIHFYTSLIVLEKDKIIRPHDEKHGKRSDIKFSYLGMKPNNYD